MNREMFTENPASGSAGKERNSGEFWFPGRWVGGVAMILGPILLLAGGLLRIQFHFFFPQQLAAFKEHPTLMGASYSLFLIGNILMWPAIVTLARLIGARKPGWAVWGGTLVIFGLFARTFHYGVNHFAFELVRAENLQLATKAVAGYYGTFDVMATLSGAILSGWIVLAIGAYLSGTLGMLRSIALALMAALMIGVLKGSTLVSAVATTGLCVALVPLGIKVLRQGPLPRFRAVFSWSLLIIGLVLVLYFFGQAG